MARVFVDLTDSWRLF